MYHFLWAIFLSAWAGVFCNLAHMVMDKHPFAVGLAVYFVLFALGAWMEVAAQSVIKAIKEKRDDKD